MTLSNLDPVTKMSARQKYNNSCNLNDFGGDIILSGVPYLI